MLMGIINAIQKMKFCVSSAHVYGHCPIGLLLQKYKLKDKIIKNFKTASTQNIKPNLLKSVEYRAFVTGSRLHT